MTLVEIAGTGLATLLLLGIAAWAYGFFSPRPFSPVRWWGAALGILNVIYFIFGSERSWRSWFLLILVSLWSFRHTRLSLRWQLRQEWSVSRDLLIKRPFLIFKRHCLLQAVQIFSTSAPLIVLYTSPAFMQIEAVDLFGLAAFIFGLFLGEKREKIFLKKNGQSTAMHAFAMRRLPHLMKEPIYYSEAILWGAFYLFALGTPSGFLTLFSPLLMNMHLRRFEI